MTATHEKIKAWREHPELMVRELFGVIPDEWQDEGLRAFGAHGDDGKILHKRIAGKASKGPGKTTLMAWCAWNFLLTRPHPKIAATSISGANLRDNLWSEMAKWQQKSKLLQELFSWTNTRIFAKDFPETWFMTARTWKRDADPQQQADTLAGLHADYILFLLDESGGIPDSVMVAAEGALASGIECRLMQMGNPTHLSGPLYRACTRDRSMWLLLEINGDPDNPKRSPRVNLDWAQEQIRAHGRDNPWVMVNVLGQFPPASLNSLISPEEVETAMRRHYVESLYMHRERVLGVDVAREGDDQSVIAARQGIVLFPFHSMRIPDLMQVAAHVAQKWKDFAGRGETADAAFVDGTGGFGMGVVDKLSELGFDPIAVHFAGQPIDRRYANKRAEIIYEFVQWIKKGGALPPDPELVEELTAMTYTFAGDRILLEPKDSIKARIGRSPDKCDAAALTFAYPVERKSDTEQVTGDYKTGKAVTEYDPMDPARLGDRE